MADHVHLGEQVVKVRVSDPLVVELSERLPGWRAGDHHGVMAGAQGRSDQYFGNASTGPAASWVIDDSCSTCWIRVKASAAPE